MNSVWSACGVLLLFKSQTPSESEVISSAAKIFPLRQDGAAICSYLVFICSLGVCNEEASPKMIFPLKQMASITAKKFEKSWVFKMHYIQNLFSLRMRNVSS
jgi:hypothetical protein